MNREIKFRAINKWFDDSEMVYFDLENSGDYILMKENSKPNEKWEIMQYTGLKDKNGKEIYEGDIVKIEYREFSEKIYRIEWVNCSFYLCYRTPNSAGRKLPPYGGAYDGYKLMEIIGNVWENPELLKD